MAKEYILFVSLHVVQMIYGSYDKRGMVRVEASHEYPPEEGTTINGVTTDNSSIPDILKKLQKNGLREARFVIDSGQILVRSIRVPQFSKKELLEVAEDGLADIDGSYEDLVYDYSVSQSSSEEEERKGGEILCCAVERKLLTSYTELFDAIGTRLKGVDTSISTLHKLAQESADLNGRTYIVSVLNGNNISSYLLEKDHYTFSNKARLFSERGTQAFISEMNSNISQLIQFNKSKRSPYPIERAYFYGLDDMEGLMVFESIRSNPSLQAEQFPDSKIVYVTGDYYKDFRLHDYVSPVGCLIRR